MVWSTLETLTHILRNPLGSNQFSNSERKKRQRYNNALLLHMAGLVFIKCRLSWAWHRQKTAHNRREKTARKKVKHLHWRYWCDRERNARMKLNQPAKSWSICVWIVFEMWQVSFLFRSLCVCFRCHGSQMRRENSSKHRLGKIARLRAAHSLGNITFNDLSELRESEIASNPAPNPLSLDEVELREAMTLRRDQVERREYRFHKTMRKL